MTGSPPALALEDLSKRFGRIHAVDHLSLQVEPGHMAGFLGPNGAGKSTTLYMIPRLVRPTHGRIRLFGVDIWQNYRQAIRSVGVTVESPAFYEYLSGRQNLELAARLLDNVSPREIDQILERIGLADRQHDRVRVYSTGMKQRLGIGRALLGRPRLLVLDEPTNGMDPEGTHEVLSFLRERVRQDGLTIFISSHLMSEVEEFCDTVYVINRGRLVASGQRQRALETARTDCARHLPGQAARSRFPFPPPADPESGIRHTGDPGNHARQRRFRLAQPMPASGRVPRLSPCPQAENSQGVLSGHHRQSFPCLANSSPCCETKSPRPRGARSLISACFSSDSAA